MLGMVILRIIEFLFLETCVKPHFKLFERKGLESLGNKPIPLALDNSS